MKTKLIYALLLSILCLSAYAESQYKSVLNNGMARWSILDYHEVDAGAISTEIVASGDTLINGFSYKKLFFGGIYIDYMNKSYDEINTIWQNQVPQLLNYDIWENHFIRESDDFSKLYIYDAEKDKEYLISDISLEKGDVSLSIFYGHEALDGRVDSVYIKDGLKHVRTTYSISYSNLSLTFIESVGPTEWFIYPYDYAPGSMLNCFQNGAVFYKSDEDVLNFCPCGYKSLWYENSIKTTETKSYNIITTSDGIELSFSKNEHIGLFLYDINGILHYEQNVFSSHVIIPTLTFGKGIYLLKIYDRDKKQMNIEKIIL